MSAIKNLQLILKKKKLSAAVFINTDFENIDYDMLYLTGYGSVGILVVPQNKPPTIIVPKMEAKKVKGIKKIIPNKSKRMFEIAADITGKKRNIGINYESITLLVKDVMRKQLKPKKLIDIREECGKLREIKTKKEIEIIKKGCKLADQILSNCIKNFKKFRTETDVANYLEFEAKKLGCTLAFPTIVASGQNATKAHHIPEPIKLKKGFCVIDYGIRYKNYCTDTTRTIYLGNPTKKEVEVYNLVRKVQEDTIKKCIIGAKCNDIVKFTQDQLGKYNKYFIHGLGHGFGIKIHELPNLLEQSTDTLQKNALVTVEPGVYFQNIGIRIEDDILVDKKPIILTKITKDLITV